MAAENIRKFPAPPQDEDDEYYLQDPELTERDDLQRHRIGIDHENLHRWMEQAWKGIIAWNRFKDFNNSPRLYLRDGVLVELQWVYSKRLGKRLKIKPVDRDIMMAILARSTMWMKSTKNGEIEKLPPGQVAGSMYKRPASILPVISRIVNAPVFSHDAKISTDPGYNAESETFYQAAEGLVIPEVPDTPHEGHVAEARSWLWQIIDEFPFLDDADIAHTYSLMLNPFVRDIITSPTPLYMVEAPERGTGKGKLAEVCLWAAMGREPPMLIMTDDNEETRKRLFTIAQSAPEAIVLDNIDKTINSAGLSTALTTRVASDRRMATQEMGEAEIRHTWVATGNNPKMNGDIFRRTVRIRLDAKQARPEERIFSKDVNEFVAKNRAKLIWSCLVLVQNWIAQGMPNAARNGAQMGSFESWANVHGGILEAAGIEGLLHNRNDTDSLSNDEQAYPLFVEAWYAKVGTSAVSSSELVSVAESIDGFPVKGFNEHSKATNLGHSIGSIANRIYGNYKVVRSGRNNWSIEVISAQSEMGL